MNRGFCENCIRSSMISYRVVLQRSKPDLYRITDQNETHIVLKKRMREIWSAGTCHRFSFASNSPPRTKSGDKSPHSKLNPSVTVRFTCF